jgi:hypothetical protein
MVAMHTTLFRRKIKVILLDKGSNPNPTLKRPTYFDVIV